MRVEDPQGWYEERIKSVFSRICSRILLRIYIIARNLSVDIMNPTQNQEREGWEEEFDQNFRMRFEGGEHVNPDGTKDSWMRSPENVKTFIRRIVRTARLEAMNEMLKTAEGEAEMFQENVSECTQHPSYEEGCGPCAQRAEGLLQRVVADRMILTLRHKLQAESGE